MSKQLEGREKCLIGRPYRLQECWHIECSESAVGWIDGWVDGWMEE